MIAPATSPSGRNLIIAPVARIAATRWVCRGRSSTATVRSSVRRPSALETLAIMSPTGASGSTASAAALRCLGGSIFARLAPRNDEERSEAINLGYDLDKILTTNDLCGGEDIFFAATGVTDGALLKGVRFSPRRITTHSLSMRARSGTLRFIETYHDPDRSTLVPTARVYTN